MISFLLFLIAIASCIFYGVVGEDKTWLLAPAFIFSYAAIAFALLKRARRMAHGDELPTANCQLPTASVLWLTFLLYGMAMIPYAAVPFESKLVTLFVGGVVGTYLVWGSELTAFKDNRILLGVLIFVVMLTACYGLIVHFKCPERVLWAERYAVYEGRLMSTYICPNHFAHLMQMLMPFCVALLFIPQAGIYLRLLSAYSFLAFLPPLYLTESRAGWLGAMAAVGSTICLMALRRSRKLFALLVILVPLCSVLLLLGGWKYSETFQRRMTPVVEFLQHQNEEGVGSESRDFRPQTWMDTIDMIKEAPLIGFGPGNYRYTYPEHRKRFRGNRIVTGHPHNEYLELMADYGLVGFGLFALAWCYGLIRILIASLQAKETRHAFIGFAFLGTAAGTMVHSFFDFEMHIYPNAIVFAFLAAVAWGPLARARKGKQRTADRGQRSEDGSQRTGDGGQQGGNGTGRSASGDRRASEPFSEFPTTNNNQLTTNLRCAGAWLLAIGFLLGTLFCLQIMGSSFIRALGDKRAEALGTRHLALGTTSSRLSADRLYILAVRLDPQNWRAYKGMGNLLFNQRYYSLEMDEKIQWAQQERSWYEKAYKHNPKDPEICTGYGKVLIFLGRSAISQQPLAISREPAAGRPDGGTASSPSAGVDEGTAAGRPDGGTASSPSDGAGEAFDVRSAQVERPNNQHSTRSEAQIISCKEIAPKERFTINQLHARGLELLRSACRYRPFNDRYWWNLGVELRKAGRYEEALDVFKRAASIKRTPSTDMNIAWLNTRLKALGDQREALGGGRAKEETTLQTKGAISKETAGEEWTILDPTNATVDRGLMDLLDKMGE